MTDPRFPGAPEGSYISEEGWLIVGDEAWTEQEWMARPSTRPRGIAMGRPRSYANHDEYLAIRRRRDRGQRQGMSEEQRAARNASNRRWRARRKAA